VAARPQGEKEVPLIIADRTFKEESIGTRRITQMGDVRNLFW
jgi:hypothetical protein